MDDVHITKWKQLEPTAAHLTYLLLPGFLITYALFTEFIRNRLHLSEPPLAVLFGIIFGKHGLHVITPREWGFHDAVMQEVTRIIVGVQCFTVGIELPKHYFKRHWQSVAMMLGPVMTVSFALPAVFAYFIFQCSLPTALIIGACLSPTDPVLAASVLAKSKFSDRVPKRLKHMLSAESACNDGVSFPFLYIGLVIYTQSSTSECIKEWFLITVLYQCTMGIILGICIGIAANRILRFSEKRHWIGEPSFIVFYLLLAILSIGVGSTLGADDFLVAFGAGVGFAQDGWFSVKTQGRPFPHIVDLLLNSAMFVYLGADIPFKDFVPRDITPHVGLWQLFLFLILVILFRRIPIVLLLKRFIPDIKTYREALFCGHFGPMGVGALFLAIEARAQLETSTSLPLPKPEKAYPPYTDKERAIELIWPVICFVVLGSTMIHGLSVAVISVASHVQKREGERAPLIGAENDGLDAMDHGEMGDDSEPDASGESEIEGMSRD